MIEGALRRKNEVGVHFLVTLFNAFKMRHYELFCRYLLVCKQVPDLSDV